ncbi:hypothetical protein TRIUR3_21731 [Triticum urartu]|uniref:Uncharacterized protein n=1 Tax=Triticum urartu TaxID=4572 RepID=M7YSL1_TRIUA|nr:hypothetical protein TRIUR3_21731 [Triticum urartu]
MADVASEEARNRMGTRNVAMVFAPNMTEPLHLNAQAIFLFPNDESHQKNMGKFSHFTWLLYTDILHSNEVDPLTALKYAVQVMNFLNLLIERALRQRQQDQTKKQPK